MGEVNYNIVSKYGYDSYPAYLNISDYNTVIIRHLVMIPPIKRYTYQWNWTYYPNDRNNEVKPWYQAFIQQAIWWIEKIKYKNLRLIPKTNEFMLF